MPADLPNRFGPYIVLGLLGEGGMGAVYRALDPRLEREVAVKVLHRNLEVSGARERFMREARTVSSLNHPNICVIFDVGEQDGDPYLVMELLKGESLKDRIGRGALPSDDLREIAFRCALALQAAHAKGVVHRDIKPANIFLVLNEQGAADVKVLDFGLAKLENEAPRRGETHGLTRAGATVGTVEYMSPEQACGEPLDARSDLFSLGAVMYEMATGQLPFRGATSAIIFSELLNRDPIPPRSANMHVPADLDRIVRSLLVKNRDARTQSATALLDALMAPPEPGLTAPAVPTTRPVPTSAIQATASSAASSRGPDLTSASAAAAALPRPMPRSTQRPAVPAPQTSSKDRSSHHPLDGAKDVLADPAQRDDSRPASAASMPSTSSVDIKAALPATLSDPVAGKRAWQSGDMQPPLNRARVSFHVEEEPVSSAAEPRTRRLAWLFVVLAALVLVAVVGWLLIRSRNAGAAATSNYKGALQVTPLLNQTGSAALDRGPTKLVELLMAESPRLSVRKPAPLDVLDGGTDGTTAQLHAQAEPGIAAEPVAVLSGFLSHTGDGYVVHLTVRQAVDNSELTTVEGTASSIPEVPATLADLCGQLRARLGESSASITENAAGLDGDGSSSLDALALLAQGDARAETGADATTLALYAKAAQIAPNFLAPRLRMAEALLRLHADAEARVALDQIAASAAAGGPHLRYQRDFLVNQAKGSSTALEDAQRWAASRPADPAATAALAQSLLAAGRWSDATGVAERLAAHDPFSLTTQRLLTRSQLAAGRADAAWKTQTWAFDAGLGSPDLSLAAAVLKNDPAAITSTLSQLRALPPSPQTLLADATYRANMGDLAGASEDLDRAAALAGVIEGAASTAIYLRAVDGWNRALAGDCAGSTPARAIGEAAVMAWMTAAWCHTAAPEGAPPSDARAVAAQAWRAGDRAQALALLAGSGAGEGTTAALMRARLQQLSGDSGGAIATLKVITGARGAAYLSGSIVYPVALAMLVEIYQATGDQTNSAAQLALLRSAWNSQAAVDRLLRSARSN